MQGRPPSVCRSGETSRRDRRVTNLRGAGFSGVELLVVVVILLVLFTLYWSFSARDNRKGRHQLQCRNQLQRIYAAMEIYASEHTGKFPAVTGARTPAEALNVLVPRYTADTASFHCPGRPETAPPGAGSLLQQPVSYAFYLGRRKTAPAEPLMSDQQVDASAKSPGQLLFSPDGRAPGNNHGATGGNVLFGDGRTEASPPRAAFSLGLTQGVVLLNP